MNRALALVRRVAIDGGGEMRQIRTRSVVLVAVAATALAAATTGSSNSGPTYCGACRQQPMKVGGACR